jgi:hypothetical protein
VEVVRRLSINMPLLYALQVPTYSRYFKDILANKYEIVLTVNSCIKVHLDLQEDKSPIVAKGPFFP